MKLSCNLRRFLLLTVLACCLLPAGYARNARPAAVVLPVKSMTAGADANSSVSPHARKRSPLVHLKLSPQQSAKAGLLTDVYAAMEWEVSSIYEDDYTYIENWNYYIRFYSDASGLSPLALPNNLTVYYQWNYDATDGYGHWTETAPALQGDTEYEIPNVQVEYITSDYHYEVVLWLLDGTGYTRLN